uniref:Uncharacterized protein n=1 Tax=Vespula pensylvanica TaxID=30213 RepID=A0A834NH54_VESPE|nr:hypothetical protein H0235_013979 [Vespula pensylvanica]
MKGEERGRGGREDGGEGRRWRKEEEGGGRGEEEGERGGRGGGDDEDAVENTIGKIEKDRLRKTEID